MGLTNAPHYFFFFLGIISIHPWNSFLNLTSFFINSFGGDKGINKSYTIAYFSVAFLAVLLTFVMEKKLKIMTCLNLSFFAMLTFFNLLYPVCAMMDNSPMKYFMFFGTVLGLATSHFIFEVC
jgi:hypothetical protein